MQFDPQQGGRVTFPAVPGAAVEVPSGVTTLPPDTTPALGLTLLPLTALPQPLPTGFTAVAAADFAPDGLRFSRPVRLTLPLPTTAPREVRDPAALPPPRRRTNRWGWAASVLTAPV